MVIEHNTIAHLREWINSLAAEVNTDKARVHVLTEVTNQHDEILEKLLYRVAALERRYPPDAPQPIQPPPLQEATPDDDLTERAAAAMKWRKVSFGGGSGWFDEDRYYKIACVDWHPLNDLSQALEVIRAVAIRRGSTWHLVGHTTLKFVARVGVLDAESASTPQGALLLAACAASEEEAKYAT